MTKNSFVAEVTFNPVFLILLIVKSFEILPKHNVYFILESFALN